METLRQFTAFLENKPGRLSSICNALAKERVSIRALTVMDSKEHSVLRLVVDSVESTRDVLSKLNTPFSETDVIAVEVKHHPGELANVCAQLADGKVNVDYMYCSAGTKNGKTIAILKATPTQKVKVVLNGTPTSKTKKKPPRRRAPVR
ncbi:ACT domain protein [Planctomycetes bacterium Pan216]|uniref:ACT domain protein n=1 Tax=Kolteria novifilia TaxID=2527975 RepID=A0A518BB86_9BACT|nr:ACT domain protein [Planctomycetes bacterium Pan216]